MKTFCWVDESSQHCDVTGKGVCGSVLVIREEFAHRMGGYSTVVSPMQDLVVKNGETLSEFIEIRQRDGGSEE